MSLKLVKTLKRALQSLQGANMSLRKESIKKLQDAVKNKSMACYNKNVSECYYLHGKTGTKCAVGVIIPDKTINKMIDGEGNCDFFTDEKNSNSIANQLQGKNTYRGMKVSELTEMQNKHDDIILDKVDRIEGISILESFIQGLK